MRLLIYFLGLTAFVLWAAEFVLPVEVTNVGGARTYLSQVEWVKTLTFFLAVLSLVSAGVKPAHVATWEAVLCIAFLLVGTLALSSTMPAWVPVLTYGLAVCHGALAVMAQANAKEAKFHKEDTGSDIREAA